VRALIEEHGFEILDDYIDGNAVVSLIKAVENSSISRSRAGIRHALEIDAVRSLSFDSRLTQLASTALGGSASPFRATLFEKSPRSNWLVVWHQDTALPLQERSNVAGWGPWSIKEGAICAHAPASALEHILAIRVHLDDSTAENGSLKVLPGTHALGVLSDDTIHELTQRTQSFECHIRSGGLLLMKPLLVHASSKTKNQSPRRVLHIEYSDVTSFADGLRLAF